MRCRAEICASLLRHLPSWSEQQSGAVGTISGWIWLLVIAEPRSAVTANAAL